MLAMSDSKRSRTMDQIDELNQGGDRLIYVDALAESTRERREWRQVMAVSGVASYGALPHSTYPPLKFCKKITGTYGPLALYNSVGGIEGTYKRIVSGHG